MFTIRSEIFIVMMESCNNSRQCFTSIDVYLCFYLTDHFLFKNSNQTKLTFYFEYYFTIIFKSYL